MRCSCQCMSQNRKKCIPIRNKNSFYHLAFSTKLDMYSITERRLIPTPDCSARGDTQGGGAELSGHVSGVGRGQGYGSVGRAEAGRFGHASGTCSLTACRLQSATLPMTDTGQLPAHTASREYPVTPPVPGDRHWPLADGND